MKGVLVTGVCLFAILPSSGGQGSDVPLTLSAVVLELLPAENMRVEVTSVEPGDAGDLIGKTLVVQPTTETVALWREIDVGTHILMTLVRRGKLGSGDVVTPDELQIQSATPNGFVD